MATSIWTCPTCKIGFVDASPETIIKHKEKHFMQAVHAQPIVKERPKAVPGRKKRHG